MMLSKISYKNPIDSNFQKLPMLSDFTESSWKLCRMQKHLQQRIVVAAVFPFPSLFHLIEYWRIGGVTLMIAWMTMSRKREREREREREMKTKAFCIKRGWNSIYISLIPFFLPWFSGPSGFFPLCILFHAKHKATDIFALFRKDLASPAWKYRTWSEGFIIKLFLIVYYWGSYRRVYYL